ncbi:hypothetical protein SEA_MAKAI_71 [Arthrobacter phage Makai]|nr:hypothetical protein SEA_MAKAI_71 [Arthrobacter phage Makai]QPX62533.1 hypothetical protein SEA_TRUCKEE_69 [Arthrobacter phage Truckee]
MGAGLKPVFKPACPKCPFELKYHVRDPEVHPDGWVLTEASRKHLAEAHIEVPKVRKVTKPVRRHSRRTTVLRLPSSRRRALV